MAQNPDPQLKLTTVQGTTRTLDDWQTMFHLCLVVLPDTPEALRFMPVVERIFAVFGDADCRTALCFPSTAAIARRVLDGAAEHTLTFVDPDKELVGGLGLQRLPAFVHLRQDTTLVSVAEGWEPKEWQQVAEGLAAAMAWTCPQIADGPRPAATAGYPA